MKLRVCVESSWNTKLSEQFEVRQVMMGVLEPLRTSVFTLFWEAMGDFEQTGGMIFLFNKFTLASVLGIDSKERTKARKTILGMWQ